MPIREGDSKLGAVDHPDIPQLRETRVHMGLATLPAFNDCQACAKRDCQLEPVIGPSLYLEPTP